MIPENEIKDFNPPLYLLLGSDAVAMANQKVDMLRDEFKAGKR